MEANLINGWDRDEMTAILDQANNADPMRAPWGVRLEDSHGWGPGLFFWFESPAEMLECVSTAGPAISLDPDVPADRERAQAIAERGAELAQVCEASIDSLRDAMEQLAEVLPDAVSWVGTPADLAAGGGEIPERLREAYWEEQRDDVERAQAFAPIPEETRPEFFRFCTTWGL